MPSEDGGRRDQPGSWWQRHGLDLAIAAGLAVVAFLLRRHGLPTDGLWLDDSVQAAGLQASPSDLFAVSADHPGYTALLIGWQALGGGSDAALTYPTLAAGVLGPALLYLGLRYCGYERSIGVLLGAALAVAATYVVYSGRVKDYTIDVLIVLGLALIMPRLTAIRWRWWTALAWIAAAAVLAFWSSFGLIAVAVAGPIIVLHPTFDFKLRVVAVAVQESICVVLLAAENNSHDVAALQEQFRTTWDAFIDFDGPIQFAGDAFVHIRRVGEYFVGNTHWFAGLCIVVAVVGLAVTAWRGRQAVRARYLLLLLLAAFVAGVAGEFPFGPSEGYLVSSGGRVSLWLIPVVAIGLAAVLQGLRGILAGHRVLRLSFDGAAFIAAAAILAVGLARDPVSYPFPGAESAAEFADSQLDERDALLIGYRSNWSFATESSVDFGIEHTPESSIGFQPDFRDPRIHTLGDVVDPAEVAGSVSGVDRVLVYYAEHPFASSEAQLRTELASTLGSLGFVQQPTATFQDASVQVWRRPGTGPLPNLGSADLPRGWILTAPSSTPAERLFACVGVVPAGNSRDSVVSATRPGPGVQSAISELDQWEGRSAPRRAAAAISGPRGSACVRSTLEATFADQGFPLSVQVRHARPPTAAGPEAVAYTALARGTSGGDPIAQGSIVFAVRGRTSAFILGFRAENQPFPPRVLSELTSAATRR